MAASKENTYLIEVGLETGYVGGRNTDSYEIRCKPEDLEEELDQAAVDHIGNNIHTWAKVLKVNGESVE